MWCPCDDGKYGAIPAPPHEPATYQHMTESGNDLMATTPRQRRNLAVVIGVVVLLALLGGCGVWLTRDEAPATRAGALSLVQGNGTTSAADAAGDAPFAAVGAVDQLRPGQMKTLEVTVTNPDQVAYRILELTATPKDANPSCSGATNLVVSAYQATKPGAVTYVVPRKSKITIPLTVMMLDTATSQDACQGVSFPVAFGGLATQGQGNGTSDPAPALDAATRGAG